MFVFETEKEHLFHDGQPGHSSTIATVLLDLVKVTGIISNFGSAFKSRACVCCNDAVGAGTI